MLMILALVAAVLLLFAAMFSRVPVRAARVLVVPGVPAMRAAWARATAGRSSAPASAAWRCVRRAAPGARSSSRPSAMRSLRGVRGGLLRRRRRRCSPRRPAAIRSAPASIGRGSSFRRLRLLWTADACSSSRFGWFGCGGLSSLMSSVCGAEPGPGSEPELEAGPLSLSWRLRPMSTDIPRACGDAPPGAACAPRCAASDPARAGMNPDLAVHASALSARRPPVRVAHGSLSPCAAACTPVRSDCGRPPRLAAACFCGGVCSALHTRLESLLVAGSRSACLTLSLAPVALSGRPL